MSKAVLGCAILHFIDDGKKCKLLIAILGSAAATLIAEGEVDLTTEV